MILKGYIFSFAYATICLLASFILYKIGIPKQYTRKAVHILVGFEWFILYHFLGPGIHFLIVCVTFLVLLIISYLLRLMPMISSDEDNSPGTVYYAIAMTGVALLGCLVPSVVLPFGVGALCTSLGDGFAGVSGKIKSRFNKVLFAKKTLFGCVANFLISTASSYVMSCIYSMELRFADCLCVGALSAGVELITVRGLDNISVTWSVTSLVYGLMYYDSVYQYMLPIILTPYIISFVCRKNVLTRGAVIVAVVLDIIVSVCLGNFGFILLLSFLICSVAVDKIKNCMKKPSRNDALKYDRRNYMQVFANGAIPAMAAIAFCFSQNRIFIVAYVAALSEAFSDTSASSIGALSKKMPFDLFRMKKTEKGMSGGISIPGTASALAAAIFISLIPLAFPSFSFSAADIFIVAISGFSGCFFDTFLGSVLQVKYQCRKCGCLTEDDTHCEEKAEKYRGIELIDNNVVNLLSASFASLLAIALYLICN